MSRHRQQSAAVPVLPVLAAVALLAVLATLSAVALLTPPPRAAVTRTVPGPTVTQSLLIIRTATPGVHGF